MAGMAERLTGEARDRARASALTLVGGITLVLVAIALYATLVGVDQTAVAASRVVAVSDDGLQVTVEIEHGSCQEPARIDVDEGGDDIVLTARVSDHVPARDESCPDILLSSRRSVTLEAPLGDRELVTTRP